MLGQNFEPVPTHQNTISNLRNSDFIKENHCFGRSASTYLLLTLVRLDLIDQLC